MGLIRTLAKGAIAKKLYDIARRPENQERARQLYRRATSRGAARRPR